MSYHTSLTPEQIRAMPMPTLNRLLYYHRLMAGGV